MAKDKRCHYPECNCPVSFPEGHVPSAETECPKCALMVIEQDFNQAQIIAILGMYVAGIHGVNAHNFNAHFELKTDFDESNTLTFSAKLKLVEIDE